MQLIKFVQEHGGDVPHVLNTIKGFTGGRSPAVDATRALEHYHECYERKRNLREASALAQCVYEIQRPEVPASALSLAGLLYQKLKLVSFCLDPKITFGP